MISPVVPRFAGKFLVRGVMGGCQSDVQNFLNEEGTAIQNKFKAAGVKISAILPQRQLFNLTEPEVTPLDSRPSRHIKFPDSEIYIEAPNSHIAWEADQKFLRKLLLDKTIIRLVKYEEGHQFDKEA